MYYQKLKFTRKKLDKHKCTMLAFSCRKSLHGLKSKGTLYYIMYTESYENTNNRMTQIRAHSLGGKD